MSEPMANGTARTNGGGKRGGRIPGAIHLEWVNFHTGGEIPVLKTANEIRALLAEKGVSVDGNVITYCQGGIRAAQAYWVLKTRWCEQRQELRRFLARVGQQHLRAGRSRDVKTA